jgi:hypothetical protein
VRNALAVAPANRLDKLREVQMRNIHANTLVRLDLVKQVSALGQLERKPYPSVVVTVAQESYDVVVSAQAPVQRDLQFDLLGFQAADSESMVFVDEFDRDDRTRRGFGNRFADTIGVAIGSVKRPTSCRWEVDVPGIGTGADGLGYKAEGNVCGKRSGLRLHARE